jgi:hypothetical protein
MRSYHKGSNATGFFRILAEAFHRIGTHAYDIVSDFCIQEVSSNHWKVLHICMWLEGNGMITLGINLLPHDFKPKRRLSSRVIASVRQPRNAVHSIRWRHDPQGADQGQRQKPEESEKDRAQRPKEREGTTVDGS